MAGFITCFTQSYIYEKKLYMLSVRLAIVKSPIFIIKFIDHWSLSKTKFIARNLLNTKKFYQTSFQTLQSFT